MTDALPAQLRALAALVERVEATTGAGIEVQTAQPAGVDPDGDLLRADLTVVVPTEDLGGEPAASTSPADDVEGDNDDGGDSGADAEESEEPPLADLTDTVRGDVLAVVGHGQEPETRADDRDVTPAAIHHNLRAARDDLGVEDLSEVVPAAPTGGDAGDDVADEASPETDPTVDGDAAGEDLDSDEPPEWAVTDGGTATATATAQTGARVTCQGCGATVSRDYARVFSPDNVDGVRTCPDCPDLIREGDGTIRQKRSGSHAAAKAETGTEVPDGDD